MPLSRFLNPKVSFVKRKFLRNLLDGTVCSLDIHYLITPNMILEEHLAKRKSKVRSLSIKEGNLDLVFSRSTTICGIRRIMGIIRRIITSKSLLMIPSCASLLFWQLFLVCGYIPSYNF